MYTKKKHSIFREQVCVDVISDQYYKINWLHAIELRTNSQGGSTVPTFQLISIISREKHALAAALVAYKQLKLCFSVERKFRHARVNVVTT